MHYGAARMAAHWSGLDDEAAKDYWARRICRLDRRNIAYVMANLPERPPNVEEFLAIARRCPPLVVKMLPHKLSQEERQINRERIERIATMYGVKSC